MQIIIVLLGITALIAAITKYKLDPFLSILTVSLGIGLALGQKPDVVSNAVIGGIGQLLGELSLVLGLGAMLGALFEHSGAAQVIAETLTKKCGVRGAQWAVLIAGWAISFSLFFDIAFILLIPITITTAKKMKLPAIWLALPAGIGILTVHSLFPPQPGPIALINELHSNSAAVVLLGLVVAFPASVAGGILLTKVRYHRALDQVTAAASLPQEKQQTPVPFYQAFLLLLLPVLLITLPALFTKSVHWPPLVWLLSLVSNPVIALLITLLAAMVLLGLKQGEKMTDLSNLMSKSLAGIAGVLLINGAAGGLKQVLSNSGVTETISTFAAQVHLSPLLVGFVTAAFLRVTLGTSTVAAITSAGIVSPMIAGLPYPSTLVLLSVGAGSIFGSHVNDPGFWLFKQYLDLDLTTVFKTWTLATIVTALVAFAVIVLLAMGFTAVHAAA
ncbi:gluconate:H+ symporter [Leuconostocaceae bacterium ESL0958]|nr:gluconate:H+ symporter [Leuconostocaceae bacterium ESL0958]